MVEQHVRQRASVNYFLNMEQLLPGRFAYNDCIIINSGVDLSMVLLMFKVWVSKRSSNYAKSFIDI